MFLSLDGGFEIRERFSSCFLVSLQLVPFPFYLFKLHSTTTSIPHFHAEDGEPCFRATCYSSAGCFLGYLDISLLVRSLRFCTLPHILSKKSIRAIVAVVRRQYECNQCQFSNRLQSFRREVTLRKHTKILVWSEKSPCSRERVSETSCKSVYKKRNVTHW